MTAQQMWKEYAAACGAGEAYDAWAFGADADALAALVLGMLAVVKAAKHLGAAQGTRAYTELPLAISIIALFATVAIVGLGAWSILY